MTRREMLVAGGLTAAGAVLFGCENAQRTDVVTPYVPPRPLPPIGPKPPTITQLPPTPRPLPPAPQTGIIRRSMWTSMGVARPSEINPMGRVLRITIHHDGMNAYTATDMASTARRIETIRAAHVAGARSGRSWADIGYHFIIDPSGRVWEGRSTQFQGAHVRDQNENNLGILCLGNYERQRLTPATAAALDRFVASQMRRYSISVSSVRTHRERAPTQCPGADLQAYLNRSRARGGALALSLADEPALLA
jgi:hypothetical protein